jgi:hypothetical protein
MKTNVFKKFTRVIALLFTILLISSCDKENVEMRITLLNNSNVDVHMWVGTGSTSASNKLKPGESKVFKNAFEADTYEDYTYTVYAGQNGAVVASITISLNHEYPDATVKFNGSGLSSARAI